MAEEYIEKKALINAIDTSMRDNPHDHWFARRCHISEHTRFLVIVDEQPAADVVEIPPSGIGDLSDGYHTFNELYHHRAVLFSVICNALPDRAWKSKLHDTGDMYEGMFIVGIETPRGQATYHYDVEPYWDMFKVKEFERAPVWDGHTPQEAIERIATLAGDVVGVVRCGECERWEATDDGRHWMAKGRTDGMCRALLEYHDSDRCYTEKDHFCHYGKRREEGK